MKNRSLCASFVVAAWCGMGAVGCGGDAIGARTGEEGGPCYPNDTCNAGLECVDGLCVGLGPCTWGDDQPCECEGGAAGTRTCRPDGTWGDCVCAPGCGDGQAIAPEECDGADLDGQTCEGLGYGPGNLACTDLCAFDVSGCDTPLTCGNGTADGPEACDGVDLRGATCVSEGFAGGVLACNANCTLDVSACESCGNGVAEAGESCDGLDLGGQTCVSLGHAGGVLACTAGCELDQSGCTSDPCTAAALSRSSTGCEFVAVDMANIDEYNANEGCFVVQVTNPSTTDTATVTVVDAAGQVLDFPGLGTQILLAPGDVELLPISGTTGECSLVPARLNTTTATSGLQGSSAYRVLSTSPIGAVQINPYEAASKHTADSSLLIPTHALGNQYVALTFDGLNIGVTGPTSISVAALQNGTTVTVVPSVALAPGGPVPAGGQFTTTLNALDHLQILSDEHFDLSNTRILASGPVAVFAGAPCSGVPMGMGYCDHLEEQMPPINALGSTYLAAQPPQRASENSLWRIIALETGTQVNLLPYSLYDVVLNPGDILEVDEEGSFLVQASWTGANPPPYPPPILVMNYLKGSEQTALESGVDISTLGNLRGDPAMILSVPVDQYETSYVFSSDDSYLYNYLVVARTDPTAVVHLDCFDPIPAARFVAVSGGYQRAVVTLSSETGSDGTCASGDFHHIWSTSPFGIWVYGYHQDVSYGHPAGGSYRTLNSTVLTP